LESSNLLFQGLLDPSGKLCTAHLDIRVICSLAQKIHKKESQKKKGEHKRVKKVKGAEERINTER
jgi:hypothetical protein